MQNSISMDPSSHNLETIFSWPCQTAKLREEPQRRTKTLTHIQINLPKEHSQLYSPGATQSELLQEQTQGAVWTHYAHGPFSPSHGPFLQPGKKTPPFQSVRALNSLSTTESTTWGCPLSWGGSSLTDAERVHSPQSDTPEHPSEKTLTYSDSSGTWLCLICSRAFLFS